MKLSQTALGTTSPGKIVNLLSNDVDRFDWASMLLNGLWLAPLLSTIVGFLVWIEFGIAGMIGVAIVFLIVPIQSTIKTIFRIEKDLKL